MNDKRACGHPLGGSAACPECMVEEARGARATQQHLYHSHATTPFAKQPNDHLHHVHSGLDMWADPMADRDPLSYFYRKGEYSAAYHGQDKPATAKASWREPIINPGTARAVASSLLQVGGQGASVTIQPAAYGGWQVSATQQVPPDMVMVSREILIGLLALASTMPEHHEVTK
jgi:hypothetical protein